MRLAPIHVPVNVESSQIVLTAKCVYRANARRPDAAGVQSLVPRKRSVDAMARPIRVAVYSIAPTSSSHMTDPVLRPPVSVNRTAHSESCVRRPVELGGSKISNGVVKILRVPPVYGSVVHSRNADRASGAVP